MNGSISDLMSEVRTGLEALYGPRLQGVYLYGSYARGEQTDESDVDVLVVLDRIEGYGAEVRHTGGLMSELSLEYEVSVCEVFVSAEDWGAGESAFLDNAREDAVPA
jgi:uncharacterized protein